MRLTSRFVYLVSALLVAACGDEGGQTAQTAAAPAAPAASAPMQAEEKMAEAATSEEVGTIYVDHTRDEIEFSLKRTKAGLEALVVDYDAAGIDSGPLKEQIAVIDTKLDNL